MISFSAANSKLQKLAVNPNLSRFLVSDLGRSKKVYSFDLLAGFSCPQAKDCQAFAVLNKATGRRKLVDGKNAQFRCYAASGEAQYPNVYNKHKANFEGLKASNDLFLDIARALPMDAGIVRIHSSGDFFSKEYLQAWVKVAKRFPEINFYGYTKSIEFLVGEMPNFPANLNITASRGGVQDSWISENNLQEAVVVGSVAEASKMGLEVDTDDSLAADPNFKDSFALVIHGSQKSGTKASKDWQVIKKARQLAKKAALTERAALVG